MNEKPIGIFEVKSICIAYEQGFGHGLDNRSLPNPYNSEHLQEAWDYGYHTGNFKHKIKELNGEVE